MTVTAARLMVVIGGDSSGAQKEMQAASRAMDTFASKAQRIGNTLSVAVTVPLLLLGKKALDVAASYDKNMNVLRATTDATAEEMALLGKTAKALGADLSLPATSASDAAEAMLELSKAGLSVTDTMGAARGVLEMSAAGNISNAESAKIAANALNAFGLAGTEATRVADLLTASAISSSGEITDMADAMKMSSAVFASAKIPIEDLVTAISEMAQKGIVGSDAGTSLKQMMLSLQAPTAKAAALMSDLGIKVYDNQGNMLSMIEIIGQFEGALGGLTQEQRNHALATIFGSDAVRAANIVLMGGVDAFVEMKEAVTEEGAAAKVAGAMTEGLQGAIEKVKSAAETAMQAGVEPLIDDIVNLADAVAGALIGFSNLDAGTREMIVKFGLLAMGAGPAIKVIGFLAGQASGAALMCVSLGKALIYSGGAMQAGLSLTNALGIGFGAAAVSAAAFAVIVAAVVAVLDKYNKEIVKTNEEGHKAVDNAWAEMLDKQVDSGKNAIQVADAYREAVERANAELEKAPWYVRLFIANQEALTGNTAELNVALTKVSTSYEDYLAAVTVAGIGTMAYTEAEYDAIMAIGDHSQANSDLTAEILKTSDSYDDYLKSMQAAGLLLMALTKSQWETAKAAAAVGEETTGAAGGIEDLSAAAMEAGDILSGLDSALQEAGWSADEASEMHTRLAIALGTLDPKLAQTESDMDLLNQALARGVVAESMYTDAALRAANGTEVLSDAERQAVQTALDHAMAIEEANRAMEEATLRQMEMAQQMSEMWTRAFDSYQSGVDRLVERQSEIDGQIAELQQKLKSAQKSGDKDAISNYKQQIAELRGEAAETSVEIGKLADEMQRTIDTAIASAAIQELQRMYEEGKITFEEYVNGLTGVQESFGLTNDAGIGIAAGIAAISGAVEAGKLPVDQYDEAMKFLAQDAADGQVDLEKLNEFIGLSGEAATAAAGEIDQGMGEAETAMEGAAKTAEETSSAVEVAFTSVDWVAVGRMIGEGIAQGIDESAPAVEEAASTAAEGASGGVKTELEMNSPSRVMMRHGENAMTGLVIGINNTAADVIAAVTAVAGDLARVSWAVPGVGATDMSMGEIAQRAAGRGESMVSVAQMARSATANGSSGGQGSGGAHLTVNIDGRSVREVMLSKLNEELA